jgi:YegS/Rv2252/BmrU family lipid kinase
LEKADAMSKKVRFIINPRSGTNSKADLPGLIKRLLDPGEFDSEICFTEYPRHAYELSRSAMESGFDFVAVAGGDGTMNEAASALVRSNTTLALLPCGSGNGLARHLEIPLDLSRAIRLISSGKTMKIDTFTAGPFTGIGTFGIGFDAHVAHLFSKSIKRGYSTYVKLVLREFSRYPGIRSELEIDGKQFAEQVFLMTFANSSQFGNNAVIAPHADLTDGLIDLTLVRPFPWYAAPHLIYRLSANRLHKSKYYTCLQGSSIKVRNQGLIKAHIDGEPVLLEGDFTVQNVPHSLSIIVP